MAKTKTIGAYAREIAASYRVSPERAAVLASFGEKVKGMDALQVRAAFTSNDLPDPLARLLVTARHLEVRGEPLTDEAPDYSANRAAADEMEQAGNKEGAKRLRDGIAAAEAQDRAARGG